MKSKISTRSYVTRQRVRTLMKALLLGLAALDRNARAQYILAPTPPSPDQTPVAMQQANAMDVFASPQPQTEAQPFKWKDLTIRPHAYYQFLYADGLKVNTNQAVNTTIQTISPGALLELGNHWSLDYSPLWTIYSDRQFSDTFGQAAKLMGGTTYNDWDFKLIQGYTDVSSPSAETAAQTRQKTYTTTLAGLYTINSKMSLDLAANQNFVSADQFSSYKEWSTMDWVNYQFEPRLNAALGVGGGYDREDAPSPDMTFEQFQGRVGWRATDKISFQLHGGVEVRQFLSGSANDLVNPIFDASIQYQPFEQTRISVIGQRSVSASYMQDQVTENTSVSADLNQRLLGKLFLDLSGGYQVVKYVSSANSSTPTRTDDFYSFNVQLSRQFLKRGTVAVLYQISNDHSTDPGFSFNTHQVGVQIGFSY